MNCSVCSQPNPEGARFCQACGAPVVPETEGPDLVGKLVGGRYRITRVIGEGGMGVVYEAAQQMGPHTRRVAVKTLLPALSADHTIVSRFYRECGIVAQLEHPNTIRLYDFGETPDKRLYIAMEYVDGEPLSALIARGPVPLERTRRILRQICGALAEAHALGIVHRDLKPDNIILTHRAGEEDFVKVLDFGIAKTVDPAAPKQTKLTQQGVVLGTPPYMSPEQLAGKEIDLRSDVYSLGIIAYEMLTGQLPFHADTPFQWATHHMITPPPPLRTVTSVSIPAEVERAVMHALEKLPESRPATAIELLRELTGSAASAGRTEPDAGLARAEPHTSPMAPPLPGERGQTQAAPVVVAYATGAAVAAPIPPPIVRRRRGRTGAWLASAGLLLGGGFAALAAWSYYDESPRTTPASPLPIPAPAPSSSVVVIRSEVDVPPPAPVPQPPAGPDQPPSPKTKPSPSPKPAPAPLPPPPAPQQPQPQPQPQQPPPPPPPTTPPPATGPQGDAACGQSRQQAQNKNIEAAAALLRQCEQSGGSSSAVGAARIEISRNAPEAVRSRAFRGDCAGAKSAVNAANSVGAGARAQATYATTSCAGK